MLPCHLQHVYGALLVDGTATTKKENIGAGGSSTIRFRPEAKKRVGGWIKTILGKSPLILLKK